MTETPKYSVIMTTYNHAAYLRQALDSVLGQTYRDFELIVCNDGSTDNTQTILDGYGNRIRSIRELNKGPGAGRNAALALAQGEFISFIDSDDFWMPWTLAQVDHVVAALPQPVCVYLRPTYFFDGSIPHVDAVPSPAAIRMFDSYAIAHPHVPDGSGMLGAMPRQIISTAGGFWEGRINCSDTDLILRLSRKMRYVSLDAPVTICVRQHMKQTTHNVQMVFQGVSRLIENQRHGLYGFGVDDAPVAVRVSRLGLSVALHLAAQLGAWRESFGLFRCTLRILPRRRVFSMSTFYGAYLGAIMLSRLLEQFSRACARCLNESLPIAKRGGTANGGNP